MAVPFFNIPVSDVLIAFNNRPVSSVGGTSVRGSPLKTTKPILSLGLSLTKSSIVFLAICNLEKLYESSTFMLAETSMTIIISTPLTIL